MAVTTAYELLDFGAGARLERFGARVLDRPSPAAVGPRDRDAPWRSADLHFDRDRGWSGPAATAGPWPVESGRLRLELRPTETGQVGFFPEHLAMLPWLRDRVAPRVHGDRRPAVLHVFAYTGLATLEMAAAGAAVTHVDAARPAVAWARRNAELSRLGDAPVRWIVDDAGSFTERERRRGRAYAGVVLDPPTYGHGPGGHPWRLEVDLPRLLATVRGLLEPDAFVLLTAHTPGFDPDRLAGLLDAFRRGPAAIEAGSLGVATADGRLLELGSFARVAGGA